MSFDSLFLNLMAVKLQVGNAVLEAQASFHLQTLMPTFVSRGSDAYVATMAYRWKN